MYRIEFYSTLENSIVWKEYKISPENTWIKWWKVWELTNSKLCVSITGELFACIPNNWYLLY